MARDTDTVSFSGPVFDSRGKTYLAQGLNAIRHKVAQECAERAQTFLVSATRHDIMDRAPRSIMTTDKNIVITTGKYTMPVVVPDPLTDTVVTMNLATYGPWLEGTGSRNLTTRFKGYHSFRLAAQIMQPFGGPAAEAAMEPYTEKMNL